MAMFNYLVTKYVRERSKEMQKETGTKTKYGNKATISVIVLSMVMIVCYLPGAVGYVFQGAYIYNEEQSTLRYYIIIVNPLVFLNASITSLIYVKRHTRNKKIYKITLKKKKKEAGSNFSTDHNAKTANEVVIHK